MSFFTKFGAVLDVLRKGSAVADKAAWKTGQMTATAVGGLIVAAGYAANVFGFAIPIDADTANTLGAGIIAAANIFLTAATSETVGILPAKE